MIEPEIFINELNKNNINFFTGIPDSLLKNLLFYIEKNIDKKNHIIAANEGNAIALGVGYHLATNKIPMIYMQNSGIGNAINPLLSIVDEYSHAIPMLLMIGWRGEPNTKDEEQHKKQGEVTLKLLETIDVKYEILDISKIEVQIKKAYDYMKLNNKPYALVVKKNSFKDYKKENIKENKNLLKREKVLQIISKNIDCNSKIFSTTGKTSRELFELRTTQQQGNENDFLNTGGMGHTSSIALAYALRTPQKNVYCIDGDAAVLMHLGSLAINASLNIHNFNHILINNGAHESVGGQKSVGFDIDFLNIAKGAGYKNVFYAEKEAEIKDALKYLKNNDGPNFLEIKVNCGSRNDLGRPNINAIERKKLFMLK